MPSLSKEVYESRRAGMRALMEREGLDALAFLTPDWAFFASNYPEGLLWTWERPLCVVVPRDGEPFALLHELSSNALADSIKREVMWVTDVAIYSEHPRVEDRLPLAPQWRDTMAELLLSHGLGRARIGVDTLSGPMAEVPARLPEVTFVGLDPALRELRWVKHPEELELVRLAAALSDWGQERYRESIRPGRLVQELDYSMGAELMSEATDRFPGDNVELLLLCLAGEDSAAPHGGGGKTGTRFQKGDVVVNILCVRLNGSWLENERIWFCGSPDDEKRRAFEAAREAQEAAAAEYITGNPVCAPDVAANAVYERTGHAKYVRHRTGHGVGINVHEYPHDMSFNTRPFRAGEVYSCEPGIYIPGVGGFRHDDTVITGATPEIVTSTPKDIDSQTIDC
jgi:Xaa-Pro aminopeptidase